MLGFGLNFEQHYDHVTEPFSLGAVVIDSGAYTFNSTDIYVETFRGRRVTFSTDPLWGDFYGGRVLKLDGTLAVNINRHFNLSVEHTWNQLIFHKGEANEQRLETNEFAIFPTYAFTTRLTLSVFGQWNSLDDLIRANARLHWIPKIGSDLYIVFSQGHTPSKGIDLSDPTSRSLVGKLVWRVVF